MTDPRTVRTVVALAVVLACLVSPGLFRDPSTIHTLAYLGFGVGVLHAVAVGTDVDALVRGVLWGSLVFVAAALCVKLAAHLDLVGSPTAR